VSPDFPEFPRRGRTWLRFLAAAFVVVALAAGTTATAGLLEVQSFVDDIRQGGTIKGVGDLIDIADPGDPQTILLIGSDHRYGDDRRNARSDTMMLVRLDKDAIATTVLSIPRDLKVDYEYPRGSGAIRTGAKINETYTVGGEALTARVIKRLLGVEINHIINVNFKGFREVVEALGCVYVDVDHQYYHSNVGAVEQYAEIDISAGYQKLCGQKSLDYVRFRHADSDFVRAARQQDFLRQIKSQYGVGRFIEERHEIAGRVGKHLRTDAALQSKEELLKLVDLLAVSADKPVRQVPFPYVPDFAGGVAYVVASEDQLAEIRRQFLSPQRQARPARGGGGHGRRGKRRAPSTAGTVDASQTAQDYAIQLGAMKFPVYYPKLIAATGQYMSLTAGEYPRKYRIKDPDGKMRGAYRFVVAYGDAGNYYGIQGTSWTDPPILRNPSADSRRINGKRLLLFYDGRKLRTVGWKTSKGSYWVQNTLEAQLSNSQMLAIAGSLTRLGR
jgi:LCP family protein required for cell wall assembly